MATTKVKVKVKAMEMEENRKLMNWKRALLNLPFC